MTMPLRLHKTATDTHWNDRATAEDDHRKVNIADLVQRGLENRFIFEWLRPGDRLLEVGCGNGYLTEELRRRVAQVDGFDFAEQMIAEAVARIGERNNRFFIGSVLDPHAVSSPYDAIVCVRVLINLAETGEQLQAIRNFARWTRPGGRLILVEGYLDGFTKLNELRRQCGLPSFEPAPINHYSPLSALAPVIGEFFDVAGEWHSGMYDVLTRVVYPLLVGAEAATGPGEFHERIAPLVRALNPAELAPYARLRGLALTRRQNG
jgi:SAM-dependent methyltransferase